MNVEERIHLDDSFTPRSYQLEMFEALDNYDKVIVCYPRRAGKDISAWAYCIEYALKKVCAIAYCLPTYSQSRSCIWDAITIDGRKFIDIVPKSLVAGINNTEMKLTFINGSHIKLLGGDNFNTALVGTNYSMIVFSEFALMEHGADAYAFARPILAVNQGKVLFLSTPRGKNNFYHLLKMAQELPDWKVLKKTVYDTKHITAEALALEKAQTNPELFAQEWETSFDRGIDGSFYGRNLDDLRRKGQINYIAHEPGLLVYLAVDIGVNDATTIIWWQVVAKGAIIRIIDCYSNTGLGVDHYAKIIQDKPYRYGGMYAPADIKVREFGGGAITRYEKARQLGLNFIVLDQIKVLDGIENVWTHFPKFWIDQTNCRSLINALENYRKEWNEKHNMYDPKPIHNWASNYADALRYMCQSLYKLDQGLTSEEFERKKNEALYGGRQQLQKEFRNM